MNISNRAYEILRMVQSMLLPALGTLYATLAGIWGLPYAKAIVGTIAAVDTFLGCIVAYIRKKWSDENGVHSE